MSATIPTPPAPPTPPTPIVPPPPGPEAAQSAPSLMARALSLATALNLHLAGVAVLVLLNLYLILHMIFVWQGLGANNDAALDQEHVRMIAAQLAARPLRGLDKKLVTSTQEADAFYATRLPYADSEVAAEVGNLAHQTGVRWTHAEYAYSTVLSGKYALTQVSMDASVSGDYRPIVLFINALERNRRFFVINGINLTGQQTGQVNLRIRLTTYLRPPEAGELSAEVGEPNNAKDPEGGKGGQP